MDEENVLEPPIAHAWMDEMTNKRPALVERMFAVFLEDEPKRLAAVRAALAGGDAEQLRFLAPSLKGAAAALGAETLRDLCLEMETAAKSGDLAAAPQCLLHMETELDRLFAFMRGHLGRTA